MTADLRQHLRLERRSYIFGSLVVLFVVQLTVGLLQVMMSPGLLAPPLPSGLQQMILEMSSRFAAAQAHMSWQQQFIIEGVGLVGAVGLFFLNWRFSFLIQRPRAAFAPGNKFSGLRLAWWAMLFLNSMLASLLLPQIVVTILLARWGRQEIDRMRPAPPSSQELNP